MVILLLTLAACDGPADAAGDSGEDTGDTADVGPDTAETGDTSEDTAEDTGDTALLTDADGDGYVDAAVGGDDCDDASAWVHPGAVEYCDAVDQDCDGDVLAEGSCGGDTEPDAAMWWAYEASIDEVGTWGMVTDVTGDGKEDFVWGQDPRDFYSVMEGGPTPGARASLADDAWLLVELGTGIYGREILDVGDVDGDGVPDMGFANHDTLRIDLHFGPFEEGEVRAVHDDADAVWPGRYQDRDNWGYPIVGGADFDGDGRADAAVGNSSLWPDTGVLVDVYFGGEYEDDIEEPCALGSGDWGIPHVIGDIDGDGQTDLHVFGGGVYLLSGADVRTSCGAELADIALARMTTVSDPGAAVNGTWIGVGDWTGDGTADIVAGAPDSSSAGEDSGELYFFSGQMRDEFLGTDAEGSYVGSEEDANFGNRLYIADVDGDRTGDIVTNDRADGESEWIVLRGGEVPPLRSDLPERHLRTGIKPRNAGAPGDVDADGHADLFDLYLADGEPTLIGVWRGFDIPWDDPTYW